MKIDNNVPKYLELTKTIEAVPKQSEKVPETLAPPTDSNPNKAQSQNQSEKSESAKLSNAAQETLIRSELELKYVKPKTESHQNELTGERQLNDSQQGAADEVLGDPMERLKQNENSNNDARSKTESGKEKISGKGPIFGSVYGDGIPGSPPGGGGDNSPGSSTSGGGNNGGADGVKSGSGNMTQEQRAEFEERAGYNQGPQSAKSKIDEINSRVPDNGFEQRDATVNKAFDRINPFARVDDPTTSSNSGPGSTDRAGKYGGKGMISGLGEAIQIAVATSAVVAADLGPVGKTYATAVGLGIAADQFYKEIHGESMGVTVAKIGEDERIAKQMEAQRKQTEFTILQNKITQTKAPEVPKEVIEAAAKKKAEEEAAAKKKKEEEEAAKKKAEEEKKKSGTDYDQESYNRRTRKKIVAGTGFDFTSNLPKASKNPGDVDPAEEGNDIGYGEKIDSEIARQGKFGLVGQPVERVGGNSGPSGNLSMGGDVDYEDGRTGYAGPNRDENPEDINTNPLDTEPLPSSENQKQNEESDQESNNNLVADFARKLRKANQIRM